MSEYKSDDPLKQYISALTAESDDAQIANAEALLKNAEKVNLSQDIDEQSSVETVVQGVKNNLVKNDLVKSIDSGTETEKNLKSEDIQDRLDDEFFALILQLGGVKLALPLVELGGIHKIEQISKLPAASKYAMGLLIKNDAKYTCIDLAKVIMPERLAKQSADNLDYKFAVQLEKTPFAVACETVSETARVQKSDIKWRDNKQKHLWNAGTVTSQMCVLVDVTGLIKVIEQSLK